MEICGTHTQTILEYGIDRLLPETINIVHGPGCAICITPLEIIDRAVAIAARNEVIFCSYGELLRVPGSDSDLLDAKAIGADVRVVYSAMDCVKLAYENPDRKVVFFAVGNERALPGNAAALTEAMSLGLKNFFVLSCQAHMPPICSAVLQRHAGTVNAVLGPGTGCSVTGYKNYESVSREFNVPIVIAGVEPIDVLEGLYKCVLALENGRNNVDNQWNEYVTRYGDVDELEQIGRVFTLYDYSWRRIGAIERSGYQLKPEFDPYNAWLAFDVEVKPARESAKCISEEIMLGLKKPYQCPAFGQSCTPQHPLGATMVATEGTCSLYYKFRKDEPVSEPATDSLRQ